MSKCIHPVECWKCGTKYCKADGVLSVNLVFNRQKARRYFASIYAGSLLKPVFGRHTAIDNAMNENLVMMPCGKCAACQIRKRKDMSVRLAHEASQFDNCCFITLTYNEDNVRTRRVVSHSVNEMGQVVEVVRNVKTLVPADVQKFMKRLRRHLTYVPTKKRGVRDYVNKVRYFAVGEYGSKTSRPHYHIIIFGWRPSDSEVLKLHNGKPIFRSAQIEKCWKLGFSSFSDVSPHVAKYCARYVTKKFARLNNPTVDDCWRVPEFVLQSTRDGAIGSTWFDKYGVDACKVGLATMRVGDKIQKCSIPQYYWNRLRRRNLPVWLKCRDDRIAFIETHRLPVDIPSLEREIDCFAYRQSKENAAEFF